MRKIFGLLMCACGVVSSCTEQVPVETKPVVTYDTLEHVSSAESRLSADSFCVQGQFVDEAGHAMLRPVSYRWLDEHTSTVTDDKGRLVRTCRLDTYLLEVEGKDTFMVTPSCGGDTLSITWTLPLLEVKGRVMDVDGTPLKEMPIRVHYKTMVRKKRGWRDSFDQDELIHTDSSGYYRTYVPNNTAHIALRTCGFLVGTISRYELLHYPTQNFLFEPFEIENVWGDYVPPYHHKLVDVVKKDTFAMNDWSAFFRYDALLDSMSSVRWIASSDHGTTKKIIRKQNAVFRNASFKISVRYAE